MNEIKLGGYKHMNYEDTEDYLFLVNLFENANRAFLKADKELFLFDVSERTLCGALKRHIENKKWKQLSPKYKVDVEFNRNYGEIKTIINNDFKAMAVVCDLILHSRGKIPEQDNLIAIEMKKAYRPKKDKDDDRNRLIALTKNSYDDVWSFDGKTLPKYVCRYILGIYYEVDVYQNKVFLEYYRQGKLNNKKEINFS